MAHSLTALQPTCRVALVCAIALTTTSAAMQPSRPSQPGPAIHPIERTTQIEPQGGTLLLREALEYVRVPAVRDQFNVTGRDMTAAVLDSGLNMAHADFKGAIKAVRNFSQDDNGHPNTVTDYTGHGTNVTGVIIANGPHRKDPSRSESINEALFAGLHRGVAIDASAVVLKVIPSDTFEPTEEALDWVLHNYLAQGITVVNLSVGSEQNLQSDETYKSSRMKTLIDQLVDLRIPTVVAAGNGFAAFKSVPGMAYPAILRNTISVGAVYDADMNGPIVYPDWFGRGPVAKKPVQGHITPFSQRLAATASAPGTTIFAPGAIITSTGLNGELGESNQEGTSQAAPIVSGIVLLMQQWYRDYKLSLEPPVAGESQTQQHTRAIADIEKRPTIKQLLTWLVAGAKPIADVYDKDDNVLHTKASFPSVDAVGAFQAMVRDVKH